MKSCYFKPLPSIFLLLALLGPTILHAQDIAVDEVRIQNAVMEIRIGATWYPTCPVITVPAQTPLTHWGPYEEVNRWLQQGNVDTATVDTFVSQGEGAAGGGFYVSRSAVDSMGYGPVGLVAFPSNGFLAYASTYPDLTPTPLLCPSVDGWSGKFRLTFPTDMIPATLKDPSSPTQISFPTLSAGQLKGIGILAIQYSRTWLNVIDAQVLQNLRELTPDLYLNTLFPLRPRVADLLRYDQKFPLEGNPDLAKASPLLAQIAKGIKPSETALDGLYQDIIPEPNASPSPSASPALPAIKYSSGFLETSSLKRKVRTFLHSRFVEDFKKIINDQTVSLAFEAAKKQFLFLAAPGVLSAGVHLDELISGLQRTSRAIAIALDPSSVKNDFLSAGKKSWARSFYYWAQYAHPYQVLLGITENDTSPWLRDLPPGLKISWEEIDTLPYPIPDPHQDGPYLERTVSQWYGANTPFRSLPEYQTLDVTNHQWLMMQKNPFFEVLKLGPGSDSDHLTVEVRFPSASNWHTVERFLRQDLRDRLTAAETAGLLTDANSTESQTLTQEILKGILRPNSTNVDLYTAITMVPDFVFVSISPFGQKISTAVLQHNFTFFVPEDQIRLNLLEALEERTACNNRRTQITRAIQHEVELHPDFPKLFDLAGIWRAALEIDDESVNDADLIKRGRAFFSRPEIAKLVREKHYREVRALIWKEFP